MRDDHAKAQSPHSTMGSTQTDDRLPTTDYRPPRALSSNRTSAHASTRTDTWSSYWPPPYWWTRRTYARAAVGSRLSAAVRATTVPPGPSSIVARSPGNLQCTSPRRETEDSQSWIKYDAADPAYL